ncbi:MAG: PBP1A family penicillin-binding protein [Candidatus Magnetominusculus sp. LBB02]|nr:PBP1A family penicillin-binding protein [Candidatus Magnetominusculus sp. LBB02]
MAIPILVFSTDKTRGKLFSRIIESNGFNAKLYNNSADLDYAVRTRRPHIIVFDARHCQPREFQLVESFPGRFPDAEIILITSAAELPSFISAGFKGENCFSDPINPEEISLKVKEIYFIKNKAFLRIKTYFVLLGVLLKGIFSGDRDNPYIVFTKKIILAGAAALSVMVGIAGGFIFYSMSDLPKVQLLESYAPFESSFLYAADGTELAEFYLERRKFVPFYKIPKHVKQAFIAVEDARFYEHHGIDFIRTFGAFVNNLRAGDTVQGGSTITQQLAKMLFLTPEKSLSRKIKEAAISMQIESRYKKDEILGFYLNQAYFGARAYGIEAASQTYFGKKTEDLGVADAAMLAALPKAPSVYSPFTNPKKALIRRNLSLKSMLDRGFIDRQAYAAAVKEPVPEYVNRKKYTAPYFVEYIRSAMEQKFGDRLYTAGFKIYTTLDLPLQKKAEKATADGRAAFAKAGLGDVEAALIAVDLKTGAIKAMVGGSNYQKSQFNKATQAARQTGSVFKPIVYLTAFKNGYSPDDMIDDMEVTYSSSDGRQQWTPHNYTRKYYGRVTLRTALSHSLNAATVALANIVGMDKVISTARTIGITSNIYPHLPAAIGVSEMTLLELTYAYTTFANGKSFIPMVYEKITDRYNIKVEDNAPKGVQTIDPANIAKMHDVLGAVVTEGTSVAAKSLNRTVYGKTGTTNDYKDAWFIGFDDNMTVGVWVGRDNNRPIGEGMSGSRAALPIWINFMKED